MAGRSLPGTSPPVGSGARRGSDPLTREEARQALQRYWLEKAERSLSAAHRDLSAEAPDLAVSRAYYACFYAVCALLMAERKSYGRHSAVRGALHRDLIRPGVLPPAPGRIYEELFQARTQGDYQEMAFIAPERARELVAGADTFLEEARSRLKEA